MTVQINQELKAYIDPLTADEYAALEQSLLAEGCRDALVLWGDVLVDGHNRYEICCKHDIEFRTTQNPSFQSMDDVRLWMIDNHLGRRSVSDYQRGVLALRKKTIIEARTAVLATADEAPAASPASGETPQDAAAAASGIPAHTMALTRAALARAAKLSSNTLGQIEQIHNAAAPELVDAVKRGEVSINAAAAVSTLPQAAQVAAVVAGKQELRELARQVREARPIKPRKKKGEDENEMEDDGTPPWDTSIDPSQYPDELTRLGNELKAMTTERDALKKKVAHLTIALAEARAGK
ncbi:ParB N-terminal domain-containing protein [Pandoraea norimbergensis]|uniref:Plasmid replication/partition related protein n=1 Tax=Pandoraea norimbergensis TaxID=93219 RepID=A0ABN4JLZ2_9BURK|nr:hypothetical protein [Pandoraea norimbergensis]ALS62074.1 hypothetical protein AT302_22060 [Pandoraea norimbergensis]